MILNPTDSFRVTVYSTLGYARIKNIQATLYMAGYATSITQGGLSVYGEWDAYDRLVRILAPFNDVTFIGGDSVHRVTPDPSPNGSRRIVDPAVVAYWKAKRSAKKGE